MVRLKWLVILVLLCWLLPGCYAQKCPSGSSPTQFGVTRDTTTDTLREVICVKADGTLILPGVSYTGGVFDVAKYATDYTGADASVKILACLAAAAASNLACDARGITGAQTGTVTIAIPDNVTLLGGNMVLTTSASPAVTGGSLSRFIGAGGLSDKYTPGFDGTTIVSSGVVNPIGFQVRSGSFGGELRGVRFEGVSKTDTSIGIDAGLGVEYIIQGNRTDTWNRGIHLGTDGTTTNCACYNQFYDNQVIHASVGVDFNDSANKNTWHGGNVQPADGGIGLRMGGTQNTYMSVNVENFAALSFAGATLVRSSNVVTVTLPSSAAYLPAYAVGYRIYVSAAVDPTFDIPTYAPVAIATTPDGTHFTYAQTAADASTTGTVHIGGYAVDIRSSGNEITSNYIESGGTAVKLHNSVVDNNFSGGANTSSLQNFYDLTGVDDATLRDNRIEIGTTKFGTAHSNTGMALHFRGSTGSDYYFLRSGSFFGSNGLGGGLSLSYGTDGGAGKYPGMAPFQAKFLRTADAETAGDYSAAKGMLATNGWISSAADSNGVVPSAVALSLSAGSLGYNYANEQETDFIASYGNAGKTIAYQWYSQLSANAPTLIMSLLRNGTLNTILPIPSSSGGTGNGFTKFTGPTTAEKTFTLPDASATILTSAAAVTAAQGGFDPLDTVGVWLREEFIGGGYVAGTIGELGWSVEQIGGSVTNVYYQAGELPRVGIARLTNDAAGKASSLELRGVSSTEGQIGKLVSVTGWDSKFLFRLKNVTTIQARAGYVQSGGNTSIVPAYWWGVRFDTGLSDTNFMFTGAAGAGEVTFDSGVAADTAWHVLRVRSLIAGTILVSLDGGTERTITSGGDINISLGDYQSAPLFVLAATDAVSVSLDADLWVFKATGR